MIKIFNVFILSAAEMDIIKRDRDRLKRITTLSEIDWEDSGNEANHKNNLSCTCI